MSADCVECERRIICFKLSDFAVRNKSELDVYKRGRNAKSPTMAKNASMSDYRRATGFEALMGYLYLADRFDRILELTVLGLDGLGKKKKNTPFMICTGQKKRLSA